MQADSQVIYVYYNSKNHGNNCIKVRPLLVAIFCVTVCCRIHLRKAEKKTSENNFIAEYICMIKIFREREGVMRPTKPLMPKLSDF